MVLHCEVYFLGVELPTDNLEFIISPNFSQPANYAKFILGESSRYVRGPEDEW